MTRFQYARCLCCRVYVVLDVVEHCVIGVTDSAWDAARAADRLERGLPVYWADAA